MKTEIIFFDIDDTLCRFGILNEDNREALRRLRHETEIKLAIATGRSNAILPPDIRRLIDDRWIDAVISTNGQYNLAGDTLVSHYPLDRQAACELAALCHRFGLSYQQLSKEHVAWSCRTPQYELMRKTFPEACLIDADYCQNHRIYQFSVLLTEAEQCDHKEYALAFQELGFHFTRWQKGGADILPTGTSKARGITDICRYFNIPVAHTMAFGDGLNDIEMLQHVGIGIAMGDGWQQLKAVADYVTDNMDKNGIQKALQHFAVLKGGVNCQQ